MPGTKAGGINARNTNYARHGLDFYKKIGAIGGKKGHTGGFFANRELARIAGAKGGSVSRKPTKADQEFWEGYRNETSEPFILPTRESIIMKLRRIWKKSPSQR